MDDDQQFCLRWNNHQSTLISVFDTLLENETLVDCTLAAEGKFLKAHKVVLSACSPYFATLLQEQYDKHPIFILKDVKYQELRAMMDYMYRGEVNISQDQLAALLKAAESLQIKGLSDNRSSGSNNTSGRNDHQRSNMNVPGVGGLGGVVGGGVIGGVSGMGGGSSGRGSYTLEQTKRARIAPQSTMDTQDMTGSREGSSSPSRRRKKIRRRSIENSMADIHDNSNSSQMQTTQSSLLQQSNAGLAGTSAAAVAALPQLGGGATIPGIAAQSTSAAAAAAATQASNQQQMTTNVTKKTESVKGISDAMNTDNVQAVIAASGGAVGAAIDDNQDIMEKVDKQNHKQLKTSNAGGGNKDGGSGGIVGGNATELVIEPKSEYDDEGNDETVEDLTLDDEDMGMDDLDHNAGTSQGGEGSSQGYAQWTHERSQDDLLLAPQEQQRDPQDLTGKLQEMDDNMRPPLVIRAQMQKNTQKRYLKKKNRQPKNVNNQNNMLMMNQSIDNILNPKILGPHHPAKSAREVSKILYDFYLAKAPKNQQDMINRLRQISPTSAETNEPSTIAAIATTSAAAVTPTIMTNQSDINVVDNNTSTAYPRILYASKNNSDDVVSVTTTTTTTKPIPTSVVVNAPTTSKTDIKPIINPLTGILLPTDVQQQNINTTNTTAGSSVIKPVPQAAAFAAALLRDGYHNFQQQLRAQELLKQRYQSESLSNNLNIENNIDSGRNDANNSSDAAGGGTTSLLESFLRLQREPRYSECDDDDDGGDGAGASGGCGDGDGGGGGDRNDTTPASDLNDGDDEDDSRFNGFDDIHLMDNVGNNNRSNNNFLAMNYGNQSLSNILKLSAAQQSTNNNNNNSGAANTTTDYLSDESQKFLSNRQSNAQCLQDLKYSLSDFGGGDGGGNGEGNMIGGVEACYRCCHCGKRYRWKSTLRRHENVECGGKEPAHQCPYCQYKSKQRGNLGVHVRKHHSDMPQLASKRRSKYSQRVDTGSDDSSTMKMK